MQKYIPRPRNASGTWYLIDPEGAVPNRGNFWLGLLISGALNGMVGTLALWFALLMAFGIGLSSNTETDRQVISALPWIAFLCPACANVPALAYAIARARWRFLLGYGVGALAGLVAVALQVAAVALYVAVLSRSA
jgi:hypothetical protein